MTGEFKNEWEISGPFEAFCQPGYIPEVLHKVTKIEQCAFWPVGV